MVDAAELSVYWREDEARDVIEEWRDSGLSMAEFSRRFGVRVERIRRWRRRLEAESTAAGPRFVRLVVAENEDVTAPQPIWVHVGVVRIEVPPDFHDETLLRLVRTLSC